MMLSPGTMAQNADIRRPLRRAAQVGRRVLRWWLDELRHLIPSRVCQGLSADPMTVQILVHDNGTDVQQVRIRGLSNVQRQRLDGPRDQRSALAWVAKRRRRLGPLMCVDVAIPAGRCLIRHRKVPVAAVERIGDVLALEVERGTPFGMEDVRHAWRVIGPAPLDDASLQVVHVVAKRRLIDPLLAEARGMGVPISAVDVVGAEGDRLGFNLLSRSEAPASLAGRLSWAIATAAALLVLVSAATVVVAMQRQDQALAQLEVETNAARTEAQAVRKRIQDADTLSGRIGALRLRRAEGIRVIALWEEVTRLLPDTAWLTNVRVENDALWIDGYARSASELVGIIARSPMFSGVALSAPVVREEPRASERFQIRMKIESAGNAGVRKAERP
jgi:general secretion pathway protein L